MVGAYFVIELPDLQDQPARYAVLAGDPARADGASPAGVRAAGELRARASWAASRCPQVLPFAQVLGFCAGVHPGCWALIGLGAVRLRRRRCTRSTSSDLPYVAASYPVAFCVAVLTFIVPSGIGTRDAALAIGDGARCSAGTVATAIAVAFRIFQTAIELAYVADRRAPSTSGASSRPAFATRGGGSGLRPRRPAAPALGRRRVGGSALRAPAGAAPRTAAGRSRRGSSRRRPSRCRRSPRRCPRRGLVAAVVAVVVVAALPVLAYLPKNGENFAGSSGSGKSSQSSPLATIM